MKVVVKNGELTIICAHGFMSTYHTLRSVKQLCNGCPCNVWAEVETEDGRKEILFFHCHGGSEPHVCSSPYCRLAEHEIKVKCCQCREFFEKVLPVLSPEEKERFLNLCRSF